MFDGCSMLSHRPRDRGDVHLGCIQEEEDHLEFQEGVEDLPDLRDIGHLVLPGIDKGTQSINSAHDHDGYKPFLDILPRLCLIVHNVTGDIDVTDNGNPCDNEITEVVDISGDNMGTDVFHLQGGCLEGE